MVLQRSSEFPVSRSPSDVIALFGNRPTGWLRGFLRLATHPAASRSVAYVDQHPWFRLGEPRKIAGGEYAARLVWWPHLDDRLFTNFRGDFRIVAQDSTTSLALDGVAQGGDSRHNVIVLNRLVSLIATALESGQDLDG